MNNTKNFGETKNVMERKYNIDLLRILSMIMIIILHFNKFGGFLQNNNLNENMYIWVTEFLCIGAVNIFGLISGYFMINSKFNIRKAMRLELQVLTYSVIIYFVAVILNISEFSITQTLYSFFPTITARYWFMTAYIGLYMLSPFLNMFLQRLTKKQFQYLVGVIVFFCSIVVSVFPPNNYIGSGNGYNIVWLVVLYIIRCIYKIAF